jgi:chromosome segregation ATPase
MANAFANGEFAFDTKSGISVEEQKEILAKINNIAEKNRQSLSGEGAREFKAKKSGVRFPLTVNISAAAVLLLGLVFLISFNGKKDEQVKMGATYYNPAEKALIEEIRVDTSEKIAAKEMEISTITTQLEKVDNDLLDLHSKNEELTAEQMATVKELEALQVKYREDLDRLQDERSRILEEARSREAALRAQLEERIREAATAQAAQQKTTSELDSATAELDRLSNEQNRIAAIEAQLTGGLATVGILIQDGQYSEAAGIVANLKYFCNNNSMSQARSYQTRKDFYDQAIGSMEKIIDEMLEFQNVNAEGWSLYEKNAKLEETVAQMQKTIDAFSAGSSGQARRLSELEESVSNLRSSVSSLETDNADKDKTITSLESDKRALTQTISERDGTINALQSTNAEQTQQINTLNEQIETIRRALQ